MKSRIPKYAAVAVGTVILAQCLQATPISGSIGFTGTYVQNGGSHGNLATATSMSINLPPTVRDTTGVFVGATSPTFATPIGVNGNAPGLIGAQLWSVLVGSITYSLIVTTELQPFTSAASLVLQGTGTMEDGTAADDTAGDWQLSFGNSGDSFTWQSTSASSGSSVPDGGMTVLLLGLALPGLVAFKKRFGL